MTEEELKRLKNDNGDLYEYSFELNEQANVPPQLQQLPSDADAVSNWDDARSMKSMISQAYHSAQSQFYDVQRLIIQEKGEQMYNDLRKKKQRQLKDELEDKQRRQMFEYWVVEKAEDWTVKDD